MSDIAPKLIELSADKLRSLHEKLHKFEMSSASLEVHHMTTAEMARRGMEVSKDEPWHDARIQIDYMEDVDLNSFGDSLPADAIEDVIKSTGSSIGNVRIVLTATGYAIEIDPVSEDVEKFNENHDPANGQFASGAGGSAGGNIPVPEHGKHAWANQLGDALNAGSSPSIDAKDVGKFLNTMANRGDNPDITNLQVNGHTLFGGEGLGIKRINMPQIPIDMRKTFISDMAKQGIQTTLEKVNAMDLKPSQSEISATKTARLYQHFKSDGIPKDKAILISKDGYVVDGHHHWAAAAAMGLMGHDGKIPVIRMSVNAKEALSAAKAWSDSHGIAAEGINTPGLADLNKSEDETDSWEFEKFNPNHDDKGRFSSNGSSGGTGSITIPQNAPDVTPLPERSPAAVAEAQSLRYAAQRVEPAITDMMVKLANQSSGSFEQLDQRLKSTDSLARKIDGDSNKEYNGDKKLAASNISDAIRYTMVLPNSKYTDGLASTVKTLEAAGFKLRVKNFWQKGDPYQGTNIKASKNGIHVELQVHTRQSINTKMVTLHKIYESYRSSTNNSVRRRQWNKMVQIAKTIPTPANYKALLNIGTLHMQQYETAQQAGLLKSTLVDIMPSIEEEEEGEE